MGKQTKHTCIYLIVFVPLILFSEILVAQAEHEIQVYASPTIQKKATIFELHTNYTFKGSKELPEPRTARFANLSLEVTHGITNSFELGFYVFTSIDPNGHYGYYGSHIR